MVEIPSPFSGTVEKMFVKEGQTVNVGIVMVSFSGGGETSSSNGAHEKEEEEEVALAEPVKEPVMAAATSYDSTATMARTTKTGRFRQLRRCANWPGSWASTFIA